MDTQKLQDAVGGMVRGEQVQGTASWDPKGQEHTDSLEREFDLVVLKDRLHWQKVLLE